MLRPAIAAASYKPIVLDPFRSRDCKIVRKADEPAAPSADAAPAEKQLVLGIVLEPEVVDSQGDIYSADEIEKTAHQWLTDYRNMSLQHEYLVNTKARPVESWIQRNDWQCGETVVKAGTWLLNSHIVDPDMWKAIKSGSLTGYSIAGLARRTPIGETA
jgi:DNA adenine methylase